MIRLSGIFRSVHLYSTPPVHLRDFKLETPLNDGYTAAELDVTAQVRAYGDGRAADGTPSRRSSTTRAGTPSGRVRCGGPPTSVPSRRPGRHRTGVPGRARAAAVVGGGPVPLHGGPPAPRPVRDGRRDALPPGRHPRVRPEGRADADQRPSRLLPRHQPPRDAPGPRHRPHPRGHGPRHHDRQAAEHELGPHLALPGQPALVRTCRRVRPLPRRRDQPRDARHPRPLPGRPPRLDRRLRRPRAEHGPPRQEPPVGGHLVPRQRGGRRLHLHRHARLDPLLRHHPRHPVRGRRPARHQRHPLPDVREPGPRRAACPRHRGHPAVRDDRVLPRDGELQRQLQEVLGRRAPP